MKRCPECGREYDNTMMFCLDDGAELLYGPASMDEPATAILRSTDARAEEPTELISKGDIDRARRPSSFTRYRGVIIAALGTLILGGIAYWFLTRMPANNTGLPAPNPAAYENYMRAKVLVASENKADVETAIGLLQQAVSLDPQFAGAWATLARAYNIKSFYFAAADDERKRLNEDAEVAIEKSLTIDPNLAEGHFARGLLLWSHARRFPHEQAIQSYKRSIASNPDLDETHHQLGLIYLHLGLFDKARAEIANALEINPGNTLARFRYGVIDLYRGKYDDAYTLFKSTPLEKNPSLHAFQTATALFKLGRTDEAMEMLDRYLRDYPNDEGGVGTSVKAMILAKRGKRDEAEKAIKRADDIGRDFGHFHHAAYNIASAYALLNNQEKAVDYLQLAADDGFPCYPLFDNDEVFKDMRQNPRFVALMAKLKQQWEKYNATL